MAANHLVVLMAELWFLAVRKMRLNSHPSPIVAGTLTLKPEFSSAGALPGAGLLVILSTSIPFCGA